MSSKTILSIISVLFLSITSFISWSQTEPKLYSVEQLQEDFSFWREKLEAKSPLLYYYNSKEETDHFLDSMYACIDHPMTDIEFYRTISPVSFFLKDVHSGIQINGSIHQSIVNHPSIIPLDIVWLENSAYVAVSDSADRIKRGTQIISINGVKVQDIFQAGFTRMSNDGYSSASSLFNVNSNFWLFYHRLFGHSDTYTFEYVDDSDQLKSIELPGTSWKSLWNRRQVMDRPMFKDDPQFITLEFVDSLQTAILTVRSFHNGLFKECDQGRFDPQIKAAIEQIEEVQPTNLILDIRANGGGDPINGKLILEYLLNDKFTISKELRIVKDDEAEAFLERTRKVRWPFYGLGTFKPAKRRFKGHTYVFIDGGTSSAAGEFSGVLRRYGNVTFLGSEAGGNASLVGGTYLKQHMSLPNTQLHAFVATICSINDSLEKDQGYGVIPDHVVQWKPEDFLLKNDPVYALAFDLIATSNQTEKLLEQLKDSINGRYGLYEGAPCVNSGPCGNFANLFYERWNERFEEKVSISFIMSSDSSECYHVLIKLPNGDYYDGGNGILTKRRLIEGYEKGMYIIDMLEYDYTLLDEMAYGLEREYPRCPNYSVEETAEIIDRYLDELKRLRRK